ncbi:hypothetical protein [Halospeciosus flavus]|uniref:Uncharacterized protein n=1 Tax=Halospeciosus flavus TaxID=3032283 RepID=A0ABD5Z157_9EURY
MKRVEPVLKFVDEEQHRAVADRLANRLHIWISARIEVTRVVVECLEERFPKIFVLLVLHRDGDRDSLVGECLVESVDVAGCPFTSDVWGSKAVVQCNHLVGLPASVRSIEDVCSPWVIASEGISKNRQSFSESVGQHGPLEEYFGVGFELRLLVDVVELHLPVDLSLFPKLAAQRDRFSKRLRRRIAHPSMAN